MDTTPARWAVALVLLFALAIRAAIPAGWMPTIDERGFALVPCISAGTSGQKAAPQPEPGAHSAHATHGAADNNPEQQKHGTSGQPCAFAAVSLDMPPPEAAAALAIRSQPAADGVTNDAVGIGRGLAAPPPPSTGPPYLA